MKGMSRMEISSVKDICVLIFLGINSWTDIRKRQVSLLSIVIFAICGTAWSISSKVKVLDFFLCAGIGLVFVGISIFTEDAVGMGDGWLIMALGTVMQPVELFSIIFIAVVQCSMGRNYTGNISQKGMHGNSVCSFFADWLSGRNDFMKEKIRKGSLTVESACVMSLILLVIMGLIYLSFFVHNRAWLTAAAYESAVSGSMEGIKRTGQVYDTARMRSEELGSAGFFGAENLSTQTNVGKEVQVTYDLDTISSYGNFNWHLRTEGTSAIIDPVKHIRKMRAAAAVLKEMGDQK